MDNYEASPKSWPPLGLPTGSVRALLTLIVVAVVVTHLARGQELDTLWIDTLLVVIAHYMASRRNVSLPQEVIDRLERDGVLEAEPHPLFLPRYTIRLIIIGTFVGLGIYLYGEGRLLEPQALSLLGMVFAYLFGSLTRGIRGWIGRRRSSPPSRIWGDASASIVLIVLIGVALPEFLAVPLPVRRDVLQVALGLVLFYFGVR